MTEIISTRLRSISSKNIVDIMAAIDSLPYKVEIKTITACPFDKKWYAVFVIPDEVPEMNLVIEL